MPPGLLALRSTACLRPTRIWEPRVTQPGSPWSAPRPAPLQARRASGALTSWLPKSYSRESCRRPHCWAPPGPDPTSSTSGCTWSGQGCGEVPLGPSPHQNPNCPPWTRPPEGLTLSSTDQPERWPCPSPSLAPLPPRNTPRPHWCRAHSGVALPALGPGLTCLSLSLPPLPSAPRLPRQEGPLASSPGQTCRWGG